MTVESESRRGPSINSASWSWLEVLSGKFDGVENKAVATVEAKDVLTGEGEGDVSKKTPDELVVSSSETIKFNLSFDIMPDIMPASGREFARSLTAN